jgi:UDP-N-acetylglucosamine--N-acetylmuramyl-(pentapeptide) pyrophosphoryl-undecaprenol N-acetylglucosamine transferase
MARVYREADMAISRAGASTCSELLATRTPSILVPYPFAADDHQRFNAASLAETGGAEVVPNAELAEKAAERILHYEASPGELAQMKKKIGEAQKTPATEAVLKELLKLNVSDN